MALIRSRPGAPNCILRQLKDLIAANENGELVQIHICCLKLDFKNKKSIKGLTGPHLAKMVPHSLGEV